MLAATILVTAAGPSSASADEPANADVAAAITAALAGVTADTSNPAISDRMASIEAEWLKGSPTASGLSISLPIAAAAFQASLVEALDALGAGQWISYAQLPPATQSSLEAARLQLASPQYHDAIVDLRAALASPGGLSYLTTVVQAVSQNAPVTAASVDLSDPVSYQLMAVALAPGVTDVWGFLGGVFTIIAGGALLATCIVVACGPGLIAVTVTGGVATILSGAFFTIQEDVPRFVELRWRPVDVIRRLPHHLGTRRS